MNQKMPVLFVGHGSPMNAVEENIFTKAWQETAELFPRPKAILSVSAHWYTEGSRVTSESQPKMIYDMYGFPDALYQVEYKAPGAPELADLVQKSLSRPVKLDKEWGYDHGTWSVLCKMYPKADIPLIQLSIDGRAGAQTHFEIGRELHFLREQGVLIFGSGNVVHNLARVRWDMEGGYDWAEDFDGYIKENILQKKYENILHPALAGPSAKLAFTTPEHFYPLLYVLGASDETDPVKVFNDSCVMGSLSMTSYLIG